MTEHTANHFHIIAVQDWGGSQECRHGWGQDCLTLAEAQQQVADMTYADALSQAGADGVAVFGERYYDLVSDNVAPGWDAIWLIDCHYLTGVGDGHQCSRWDMFTLQSDDQWGEPYWTASPPEHDSLRLIGSKETTA